MKKRNIWLIVVPAILFILLAIGVTAEITVTLEGLVYSESVEHMSPLVTNIMKGITHIGDSVVVFGFCLLLILLPKSRKSIALPVSIAVILSSILNFTLKNIFSRERPNILRLISETSYSFPSGHAMINATFYTMLILLIFEFIQNKSKRIALSSICVALTIAIGFSRIYLGVHYAGDVLGGWLIGFALSVFVYSIWNHRLSGKKK
jgi:undecaprenyl-diphosphatase